MARHLTPPCCPRPRPGAIVSCDGGLGAQLKLPTGQHLCGSERGPVVSNVAAEAEVSPEGKRAAVRMPRTKQSKGEHLHSLRPQHVRAGAPTCAWPGQGDLSGDRLIIQSILEGQHDLPSPRTFHALRAAASQPGPSRGNSYPLLC